MIRHFASPLIGWPLVIIGGFQLSTILGVWCCVGAAAQLGGFTFLWIRHRPLAFDEPEPEPISRSQASTARFGIWFVPVFYVYISALAVIYVGFSPGLMLVMLGGLILLVNNMLFCATTLRAARKQDRQSFAG